ncbi:hypothetical protein DICPUDRAFT_28480 [Dictyostelium purpureum]|uniref:Alpha/beta hydrolase fold-3 domain-containing protein n=1 Tax=Dictyostelium purpureum TaxID=5786 RepID=F0ZBV7_DICPU|nr:uncharacterized protein DICPUDRAFT_28480 [Dictyostelium purpureum]EGC38553.1 hypothetical protein DICPUDRAFT_28480 [Dictyostelium purpureum]|eukprot:XP_003284924.1 hypothetical protein DICPUDRAFT_28480 [Dictyostelium purpureum]
MDFNKNNIYNLDKTSIELCEFSKPKNLQPYQFREIYKDKYIEDNNKYKSVSRKFEVPKEYGESINVLFYYPDNFDQNSSTKLPVIIFVHGGGFIVDGLKKLPNELCNRTNSIVVYPEYSLAPESKYPIGVEQCYQVLIDLSNNKYNLNNLDLNNISVFGESSGGNFALSLCLLAKSRDHPSIIKKVIAIYPVVDYNFETKSYKEFDGYYLSIDAMKDCWAYYLRSEQDSNEYRCCPSKATKDQLKDLVPQALFITPEVDVLRDEGEQFAKSLSEANNGKNVTSLRFNEVIHGFLSLDQLDSSSQCRLGMDFIVNFLNNIPLEKLIEESSNKKLITRIV